MRFHAIQPMGNRFAQIPFQSAFAEQAFDGEKFRIEAGARRSHPSPWLRRDKPSPAFVPVQTRGQPKQKRKRNPKDKPTHWRITPARFLELKPKARARVRKPFPPGSSLFFNGMPRG